MSGAVIDRLATAILVAATLTYRLASAAPEPPLPQHWVMARNSRFQVYSDSGPDRAREVLTQFEELRQCFARNHLIEASAGPRNKPPVRVIEFDARRDYDAFTIRATADAYYTGTADRDYIVMPRSGPAEFGAAAHEYAHFLLHSAGLKLPSWLSEGLAEVFSTVTMTSGYCQLGGPIAAHIDALRRGPWLSSADLFTATDTSELRGTRAGAAIFYAESWAVTDMLASSPQRSPRFAALIALLKAGDAGSTQAIETVYNETPEAIVNASRDWFGKSKSSRQPLQRDAPDTSSVETSRISDREAQSILADLLFVNGQLKRAEKMYRDLLVQAPHDPEILASLGATALKDGDRRAAAAYWREALEGGLADAALCYRYATLADQIDLPAADIERALSEAVRLKPDFDEARFRLALIKSNASDFAGAVTQLKAMAKPDKRRAFAYWMALAYALTQLDRSDEAQSAAKQARDSAASPDERNRASEIAYIASTDLAVRYARDAAGNLQLVTTRVPRGSTDFNPFIEPADHMQTVTGNLLEARCTAGKLSGFDIAGEKGKVTVSLPDPTHVLISNGPHEFYCGPQPSRKVKVDYAISGNPNAGVLRGMDFQ